MNKLTIIKAPTGLGKSRTYIQEALKEDKCSKVVVLPTNRLKDQIYNDSVKLYGSDRFMKTPERPEFKVKEIKERVDELDAMGLHSAVNKYLYKKKKELEKKEILTDDEVTDIKQIDNYLEQNRLVNKFEGNVIATQDRLFYFSDEFFKKHKILIDEDILKRVLKITKISMADLLTFSCHEPNLLSAYNDRIMSIVQAKYEQTEQLKKIKISESNVAKEVKDKVYEFDIMAFLNAKAFWKYNPKKEIMENDKELRGKGEINSLPNANDEIYFLEVKELPKYDIVLFSATADEDLYKSLLWGFEIEVLDVGEVKYLGQIQQYPSSSCSRYDLKTHNGKFESIREKYPHIADEEVITFKTFNTTQDSLNFGNTEGKNEMEGKDILIIGTPHYNEAVYKLYAYVIDNYANNYSNEQIKYQEIEYNNCKFWFNTYSNPFLKRIQMWLINSELEQAVGRARLLRNKCIVYLYSNFPVKQANFVYDEESE